MLVTDLTGDTIDDGSIDLSNENENIVACVTPTNPSLRQSRDKLQLAIGRPYNSTNSSVTIYNAPKDWNALHQTRANAFPYHINRNKLAVTHVDEISICESIKTVNTHDQK